MESIAVFFIKNSVSCIIARRVLYQRFHSMAQRFYGLYHDHHDRRVLCIDKFTKRLLPRGLDQSLPWHETTLLSEIV